jgi:hypothetical protein
MTEPGSDPLRPTSRPDRNDDAMRLTPSRTRYARPSVSNIEEASASRLSLPAHTTNWKAW